MHTNETPVRAGTTLPDRYAAAEGTVLLSGVQALVRLPMDQRRADIDAGLRTAGFVTGYPGSPLAGYDAELARRQHQLAELGIVHQPALNEELAATAVAGSQLASLQPGRAVDGVTALWYGKAPGLDRAGDAIRHGNLMGAGRSGGVLVCGGDDPQAKSSSVPSTSEPTLFGLGLPVLAPADPQELLDLGLHGFALSRASGLWAGLRLPASVADALQTVEVGTGRVRPVVPEVLVDGRPFVHRPTAQLL
ncbi:MAG: 2-oxoacid ferredoxin oxidoreductase, partial [Actinomycetota bacterium]|nr:2-oxoacid ferredoxin oxidoreductase [Actinomycetota bacterium]